MVFKTLLYLFLIVAVSPGKSEGRIEKRSPEDKETSLFGVKLGDKGGGSGSQDESNAGILKTLLSLIEKEKNQNKTTNGFLPLPPGYNKLVIPLGNASEIFVIIHVAIREILNVDTIDEFLELDTELELIWIDWEIWNYLFNNEEAKNKLPSGQSEIILDADFLKEIWKPDLFIEEMAGIDTTFLLSKLITLKFLVGHPSYPGAITFKSRQTFKVRCDMDFQYYPADTQNCPLHIRSYSFDESKLFLVWNPEEQVYLNQIKDSNYDMQVSEVEPGDKLWNVRTISQSKCCDEKPQFSTVTFTIQVRRNIKYHLTQTALPSVLLILITWLCFLIPPDMVEARIGVSMTTLLTMTAMFSSVRQVSPQVSYIMAIDVWMVVCILMLFIALVLFTVIYWMRRRLLQAQEKQGTGGTITRMERQPKSEPGFRSMTIRRPSRDTPLPDDVSPLYYDIVIHTRKYSFALFSFIFIVFLISYCSWIMINSDYNNWEPSSKYNAVPTVNEDGSINEPYQLFEVDSTTFRPNNPNPVAKNFFRLNKLFERVVDPFVEQRKKEAMAAMEANANSEDPDATTENGSETTTG